MSWIEELYNTYENCKELTEAPSVDGKRTRKPLVPPFHKLQNSHIEVRIDGMGNFIEAHLIENKNDQEIIIPCTEKSAARTSGEEPYPFCDKIQYCAQDYVGSKKTYFNSYQELLGKWATSEFGHPMVKAVFNYINKGTLFVDIKGTFKQFGNADDDLADLLVRWKIEVIGENETRCWRNKALFESWKLFAESQDSLEDICMVTGAKKSIALNHPNRIRNSGDSARLISSNDKSGYTFLGRFTLNDITLNGKKEKISNQSASISAEVTQKAHSALTWLIDRQSFRNGDQVILSWAVSGKETPDLLSDSLSIFEESDEEKIQELISVPFSDAGQKFAKKLSKKISGYKAELNDTAKIIVMGLDSAGPGRLSITYYRELTGSDFLERLENWHKQMAWHFLEFVQDPNEKKKRYSGNVVFAPAPRAIAESCYGKRLDDKLKKSTIERLLPCIIDGRQIPYDLVDMAVKRASNKIALDHWEWEQTLSVACALYSCYTVRNNNLNKTDKIMALENERTDRDYLYGRLLAVAEHIEERALYLSKENRETNAARMMQMFSEHPFSTWKHLWEKLNQAYLSRLQSKRPEFLFRMKNLVGEINSLFVHGDFENDSRLSGLYLLGYHCQRLELVSGEKHDDEKESENN